MPIRHLVRSRQARSVGGLPGSAASGARAAAAGPAAEQRCVLLVLWADAGQGQEALDLVRHGVPGLIPKDHSAEQVDRALDRVLQGGAYLPGEPFPTQATGGIAPALAQAPQTPQAVTPQALGLTPRQAQVLQLVLQGNSNKHIGRALNLAQGTVKTHVSAVLRALNVDSRVGAVLAARRVGLESGS